MVQEIESKRLSEAFLGKDGKPKKITAEQLEALFGDAKPRIQYTRDEQGRVTNEIEGFYVATSQQMDPAEVEGFEAIEQGLRSKDPLEGSHARAILRAHEPPLLAQAGPDGSIRLSVMEDMGTFLSNRMEQEPQAKALFEQIAPEKAMPEVKPAAQQQETQPKPEAKTAAPQEQTQTRTTKQRRAVPEATLNSLINDNGLNTDNPDWDRVSRVVKNNFKRAQDERGRTPEHAAKATAEILGQTFERLWEQNGGELGKSSDDGKAATMNIAREISDNPLLLLRPEITTYLESQGGVAQEVLQDIKQVQGELAANGGTATAEIQESLQGLFEKGSTKYTLHTLVTDESARTAIEGAIAATETEEQKDNLQYAQKQAAYMDFMSEALAGIDGSEREVILDAMGTRAAEVFNEGAAWDVGEQDITASFKEEIDESAQSTAAQREKEASPGVLTTMYNTLSAKQGFIPRAAALVVSLVAGGAAMSAFGGDDDDMAQDVGDGFVTAAIDDVAINFSELSLDDVNNMMASVDVSNLDIQAADITGLEESSPEAPAALDTQASDLPQNEMETEPSTPTPEQYGSSTGMGEEIETNYSQGEVVDADGNVIGGFVDLGGSEPLEEAPQVDDVTPAEPSKSTPEQYGSSTGMGEEIKTNYSQGEVVDADGNVIGGFVDLGGGTPVEDISFRTIREDIQEVNAQIFSLFPDGDINVGDRPLAEIVNSLQQDLEYSEALLDIVSIDGHTGEVTQEDTLELHDRVAAVRDILTDFSQSQETDNPMSTNELREQLSEVGGTMPASVHDAAMDMLEARVNDINSRIQPGTEAYNDIMDANLTSQDRQRVEGGFRALGGVMQNTSQLLDELRENPQMAQEVDLVEIAERLQNTSQALDTLEIRQDKDMGEYENFSKIANDNLVQSPEDIARNTTRNISDFEQSLESYNAEQQQSEAYRVAANMGTELAGESGPQQQNSSSFAERYANNGPNQNQDQSHAERLGQNRGGGFARGT